MGIWCPKCIDARLWRASGNLLCPKCMFIVPVGANTNKLGIGKMVKDVKNEWLDSECVVCPKCGTHAQYELYDRLGSHQYRCADTNGCARLGKTCNNWESAKDSFYDDPIAKGKDVSENEAKKFDEGKARYDLIPPEALEQLVDILTFGAKTYGDRNWEQGLPYGRIFAATMRHLWKWWRGEDCDPESKLPHLAHAACNIFFLMTYEVRVMDIDDLDDRPD